MAIVFPVFIVAALCLVFLVTERGVWNSPSAVAQEQASDESSEEEVNYVGKDTQILKFTSMLELQTYMKEITEALGVDCKYCHDITAFEKTVEGLHKDESREMMKMVNMINENFLQDYERKVTCFTCHHGHERPVENKQQWMKLMQEEEEQ
jgi:hypothetical protein